MQNIISLNKIKIKKKNNFFIFTKKSLIHTLSSIRSEVFTLYIAFFFLVALLISSFDKFFLHLKFNQLNTSFFDVFFKYATFLGDGVLFGLLGCVFFFIKRKMFYVFTVGGFLTLLITHILKKILFKGLLRPVAALGKENLHLVDGVKIAMLNTFPSGHTITAFAIFTILCLCFSKCKSQYLWFSLAVFAGLSRVYLSQHFLIDIFFGSFIGIFIGVISMALFYKPNKVL